MLQRLRDLLAAFPIVRRIETERLALDLDTHAESVPAIQTEMDAIQLAVRGPGAATADAVRALGQNDAAIEDAIDPVVERSLVADKLLVFRNFARAVIGGIAAHGWNALDKAGPELANLSGDVWKEVRACLPSGNGLAITVAPLFILADQIGDPYLRIGAAVPAVAPVARL